MDNFYLFAVVLLFLLAIFDLIIGVSNDAVNFLNSAIGSRVTKRQTIMLVASAGVLIGAITSGGMMEVARKGIFNPEHFYFDEVMVIFLAVMITDIILLDIFNTLAMPTSTTVSIVFEILGAAFALSIIKILQKGDPMNFLFNINNQELGVVGFMNWSKASQIISGIFLSVIFAFTIGALVQFFSRWLFGFEYNKKIKGIGIFWAALAFSFMFYFLIFKGFKSTYKEIEIPEKEFVQYVELNGYKTNAKLESLPQTIAVSTKNDFIEFNKTTNSDGERVYKGLFGHKGFKQLVDHINQHIWTYAVSFFIFISLFVFILNLFKINYLKLVVLFGTFCLAMAFAGNDLVNFIGIPVAGIQSFHLFSNATDINPALVASDFRMFSLKFPQETPFVYLAIAGLVMVLTLWFSKKSRSVTETEVNLGAQSTVDERFQPNFLARFIVNSSRKTNDFISKILPKSINNGIESSFAQNMNIDDDSRPAFDLIRASVNLSIASILIAIATNMKLPLSTTYVSFMVAMGTSLADRAWGRESAVYRVAGVMNVIGGWFLTAFIAMTAAGFFATLLYFGKSPALLLLVAVVIILIYRSSVYHKKSLDKKARLNAKSDFKYEDIADTLKQLTQEVSTSINSITKTINLSFEGLNRENPKLLSSAEKTFNSLEEDFAMVKSGLFKIIKKNTTNESTSPKLYVLTFDLMQEIIQSLKSIVKACSAHVKNNHKPLTHEQIAEITEIETLTKDYMQFIQKALEHKNFSIATDEMNVRKNQILDKIEVLLSNQIDGVTDKTYGFKNTSLYFNILLEMKDIIAVSARFIKMFERLNRNDHLI